jgi:hypothetical protein
MRLALQSEPEQRICHMCEIIESATITIASEFAARLQMNCDAESSTLCRNVGVSPDKERSACHGKSLFSARGPHGALCPGAWRGDGQILTKSGMPCEEFWETAIMR